MTENNVPQRQPVEDVLGALRRSAQELLSGSFRSPSVVRVRVGDAAIELEWAPLAAPARADILAEVTLAATVPPVDQLIAGGQLLLYDVCAPTVGVFYLAPEPGAAPFVNEGDTVEAGQQVGILEAMKIMIPVETGQSGRIFAVLKSSGAQVEYGEPLFVIEPAD